MNPTLQSLFDRKSVRNYTDQPISPADKALILRAAFEAPTAGNQMLYTIIDVTDPGLKDRLAVTCDNQPFIAKAPLVLIFLADQQRWYDTYLAAGQTPRTPQQGDILLAFMDACIAAQNAVVAAQSLGIGSCYIGDILENIETHRQLLNLPDYVIPAAMLVFGYPTEGQKQRQKPPRFDPHYIVAENGYRQLSPAELEEMYLERERRAGKTEVDFRASVGAFCARKYMSDFSVEMSRSAALYLEQFKPPRP
ncbi:MAG TPA: nitroreductase family protein [Anaerolineaceae bacterium]|nr:nitroreductase family protein [Anaerolineaceae bacterium]